MSKCPYTWVRNFFGAGSRSAADPSKPAKHLMVRVVRDGEERVRVALPARSAKWLIELIPADVVAKIRAEDIPLDAMMHDLNQADELFPHPIFSLNEEHRQIEVWLE